MSGGPRESWGQPGLCVPAAHLAGGGGDNPSRGAQIALNGCVHVTAPWQEQVCGQPLPACTPGRGVLNGYPRPATHPRHLRRKIDQTLLQQLLQGLAFYSFAEEQVRSDCGGGEASTSGGSRGAAWLQKAEERLGMWLQAEQDVEAARQQQERDQGTSCSWAAGGCGGQDLLVDVPRPGLLAPPPGAVHRTLPPLLLAELPPDGAGGYKLRQRVSGGVRRDKRPSAGRRRAISEFSVRVYGC
jgi:hypothetical protein